MRQLYLAATGQNRGKTTTSLGLFDAIRSRGLHTGFTKPVGQRTVIDHGMPADEDAVLMHEVYGLPEPYTAMSPVHIPRGFTKAYIAGEVVEDLGARIVAARDTFLGHDVLLIEGTGHAGVGAVIGLSNAAVASMLGAPVVIVSEGGVGRPIDEIVLNAALFERHGVRVAGAVVNKVDLEAQPGIRTVLERGLSPYGIPLLGVLPVQPLLSNPTLEMIVDGVAGETIHPGPDLDLVIDDVAIGAMQPGHMLERIGPGTLVIAPGDRDDAAMAIVEAHSAVDRAAIGLVLTGGYRPSDAVLDAIRAADLFAILTSSDTYAVASRVHDLLVKTHAADRQKIELIKRMVGENLDVDRILAEAAEVPAVGV